jgi:hypothetical protein
VTWCCRRSGWSSPDLGLMSNSGNCNESMGAPSPGFPIRLGGVNELHAAFLIESCYGWGCAAGNPGSFALFCEGWDTTNLDTDRRVSHPLQRTQRMGHPPFRGGSRLAKHPGQLNRANSLSGSYQRRCLSRCGRRSRYAEAASLHTGKRSRLGGRPPRSAEYPSSCSLPASA